MVRVLPTYITSVIQSHRSTAMWRWGQPTAENSLSPQWEESATIHAVSVSPHHLFGKIYHKTYAATTLVVNNSLTIWKHFCLHGPIRQTRLWEHLFKRRFINGLIYLLTCPRDETWHSTRDSDAQCITIKMQLLWKDMRISPSTSTVSLFLHSCISPCQRSLHLQIQTNQNNYQQQ